MFKNYSNELSLVRKDKQEKSKILKKRSFLLTSSKNTEKILYKVTAASRAKLSAIPNRLGPYECKLCFIVFKDAFDLALHSCAKVERIEHKCDVCGKVFNCAANLASHTRWHRPKIITNNSNRLANTSRLNIGAEKTGTNTNPANLISQNRSIVQSQIESFTLMLNEYLKTAAFMNSFTFPVEIYNSIIMRQNLNFLTNSNSFQSIRK